MKECIICYNAVKKNEKSNLNLICECRYVVHNKCYKKWYEQKKSCIICREFAYPPGFRGQQQLLRDICYERRQGNITLTVRRNVEPRIISFMKAIIIVIIIYYVFLKEKGRNIDL
jgi:hypothetical protein|uniref:RING-type domain-containing protein n=1 Tax=viral metagenome TaxID=1070528 RepID=A0A6C0BZ00_9ZZZZ